MLGMEPFTVTAHAIERFMERVRPCRWDEAETELRSHERAVLAAASIGCRSVRLGSGARLVLEGSTVVKVYPREVRHGRRFRPRCLRRNRECEA